MASWSSPWAFIAEYLMFGFWTSVGIHYTVLLVSPKFVELFLSER